jgi:nucleotide-binding universal stress UspA family protein
VSISTPSRPTTGPLHDNAPDRGAATAGPGDVVVGTDGTDCALGAVRWAAREAARRGVPLRIVHAAQYLGRPDPSGVPSPEMPTARRITAQAYTVAMHTAPGLRASTEVVAADPATALLTAADHGALLVLGSSATGAADEMVLAPVVLRVGARSSSPVVIVPRLRGRTEAARPVLAVLGIGEQADDEAVAEFAADAAQQAGVGLTLVQTRTARRGAPPSQEAANAAWERRFPGVPVTTVALPGATPSQLLSAASSAPLTVLSAGRDSGRHRSPDSAHRWLLRHCTSPMALVPTVGGRGRDAGEPAATD